MLSKYQQFKSWCYWNMPDTEDIIFFGGMGLMLVTAIVVTVMSFNDSNQFITQCEAKGGITIKGAHQNYYCIDKEAIK